MTKSAMTKATKWRQVVATKWRQVVATGESPWIGMPSDFPSPEGTTGVCDDVCDRYGPSMHVRPFAPSGLRGRFRDVSTGSRPWLHHAVPLGLRVQPVTAESYECPPQAESIGAQVKTILKGLGYDK